MARNALWDSARRPDDGEVAAMTLHLGGQTFRFADAASAAHPTYTHGYAWPLAPPFGWTTGATVAMSITALPIVQVFAGANAVAYRGTVEFLVTRTGSTDDALSFTLRHVEGGETTTRTFPAGEPTFRHTHWARETDERDNPVCSLTWALLPGEGYVLGHRAVARVGIEGPGTTCMSGR